MSFVGFYVASNSLESYFVIIWTLLPPICVSDGSGSNVTVLFLNLLLSIAGIPVPIGYSTVFPLLPLLPQFDWILVPLARRLGWTSPYS